MKKKFVGIYSVILVGEAGSGKTHHSKAIAKHFNLDTIDDAGETYENIGDVPKFNTLIVVQELNRALKISKLRVIQMTEIRKDLGLA